MLSYRAFGNPSNQPLVFLHGFLGSSLDFSPLITSLQEKYFCLALDLPAHGKSPYCVDTLVAVEKTIDSFQIEPFLIGYSLGGRIALHLSQKTKLPIKGSIILSSHVGLECPIQKKARLKQDLLWAQKLKTLIPQDFLKSWYQQATFSSLQKKPLLLEKLLIERLFTNKEELALILEEMTLAKQPLLNSFSTPTHFLCGEDDIKIKDLYTAYDLPKTEIENAGHVLHLENPTICSKVIQSYLTSLKSE